MSENSEKFQAANLAVLSDPASATCPQCASDIQSKGSTYCPYCGFDPRSAAPEQADAWARAVAAKRLATPPALQRAPLWALWLLGGIAGILLADFAIQKLLADTSRLRHAISVGQVFLGGLAILIAHAGAYLTAIMEHDGFHLLDFILRPIAIWRHTFKFLPHTTSRVCAAGWGIAAVTGAFAFLGGISFDFLWEWELSDSPSSGLTVATQQSINDAVKKIVKDVKGVTKTYEKPEPKKPDPRDAKTAAAPPKLAGKPVDCLIIGFVPAGPNEFSRLVLAADVNGKLRFVGTVTDVTDEARVILNKRMREIIAQTPIVQCGVTAQWLEPRLTCRVRTKGWSGNFLLMNPQFEKVLGEIAP